MTGLEVAAFALAVLAVAFGVVAFQQHRALGRVREVAAAVEEAARSGGTSLALEEPDDGSIATRLAQGARQLMERAPRRPAAAMAATPAMTQSDAAFAALAGSVHQSVVIHRERILFANPAFSELVGVPEDQLAGRELAELVTPEYAALVRTTVERHLGGGDAPRVIEVEVADAHGQVTRLELTSALVRFDGSPAVLATAVEMLPRAQTVGEAGTAPVRRQRAQLALDALAEGLITTDGQGRIDYMNPAAEKLAGVQLADAAGKTVTELLGFVDEHDRRPLPDPVRQCLSSGAPASLGRRALMLALGSGTEYSIEVSAAPVRSEMGELIGAAIVLHDVTEMRGLARQMSYQASHDALTGLVNRREFERRLAEALEPAHSGEQTHVMCYMDLDRFKAVNDTCGHVAGDNMLREVAALIKDAVRDSDTVARLGGDEFGMLLMGCPLEKARQIADDVCRAVNDYRFVWKDRIFNIGVSIGLIEIGRESGAPEEVMSAADSACYVAKTQAGGNHVHVYSARDEAVARHRGEIHWLQQLQSALKDGRFELYSQPIVSAHGGHEDGPGLEVFVRLRDEAGKPVSPGDFMGAAERYRLMPLVDRWVVQAALAAMNTGSIKLAKGRSVSINIAGQTLGDPTFLEFVVDAFDRTGVHPVSVCFEVNETSVIGNLDNARRFIGVLHGMGCQFALDDFGNDLGAFANLKHLSMDYLKIDGTFMRNLARDTVNQAMVAAMIRLARTLNFRVIAEQVEDPSSLEAARSMGVDFMQGYALGRPEPLRPAA